MSRSNPMLFWGGFSLLISSITGPGLISIPIVFQQAGWLFPTIIFLIVGVLSGSAALFVCEAMSAVEGNDKFQAKVEFTTLAELFLGNRYHTALQIILFLSLQSLNVASMIISTQGMDSLLITLFGTTCGIAMYPPGIVCVYAQSGIGSPFMDSYMFVTGGLFITFVLVFPLGLLNLADNVKVQIVSLLVLVIILIDWMVTFSMHGLTASNVPAIGEDLSQVVGIVLFNFAFITTIPSFVNSLAPKVSIRAVVWWSVGVSTFMYIALGLMGALAYQMDPNSNLIVAIQVDSSSSTVSIVTTYLFPVAVLITSIPVYTIVIRANLIRGQVCGRGWAIFWSSILPWLFVIPFQTGWWLNMLINYVSLIFTSSSNFIIPFLLYFASKKYAARAEVVPDGPGDEYNLVLMDSTTSGRTLNSVHMGSAIPMARSSCSRTGSMLSRTGSMLSRTGSMFSPGSMLSRTGSMFNPGSMFEPRSHHGSMSDIPHNSPIITIIPPEDTDTDPWDPRPSSPMHVIHPLPPSHHSFSASLPTIVEPVKDSPADSEFVNSEDEKGSPRPLRPHGLKIIIPQQLLAPPLSTGTSPKRDHSPGSLSSSPRCGSSFSCSYKRSSVESYKPTTDDPSTPSLTIPTLTVPQPSPTLTVDHSSSVSPRLSVISMRSSHSRKSSSDSNITPSILVSMTADNHTAYLADGRISGGYLSPSSAKVGMPPIPGDEVRLFRAFPEAAWFNPVCYGWIATGLMTAMVIAVLVYDFVMLGLQGLQRPGS